MMNKATAALAARAQRKIRFALLISCILHFTEYEEHPPIRRHSPRAQALLLPHTRTL